MDSEKHSRFNSEDEATNDVEFTNIGYTEELQRECSIWLQGSLSCVS